MRSLGFGPGRRVAATSLAESSLVRSAAESHSSFGCQILRKPIRHAIEISDAPMSTIHGLMKFEIRNCGIANETPVTRIAGHTSFMPFQPAKAQISQNGTMSEKNGNCRPTIAPRKTSGPMPVIACASKPGDRRAERAVGDRRGVGDQREAGGRERREAEPDQDRAGDGDRRAEAGRALEERAEARTR